MSFKPFAVDTAGGAGMQEDNLNHQCYYCACICGHALGSCSALAIHADKARMRLRIKCDSLRHMAAHELKCTMMQ